MRFSLFIVLFFSFLGLSAQSVRVWRDGHLQYEAQSADSVVLGARLSPADVSEHLYVDLGLSVLWATCNVGASEPQQTGDNFAWGETSAKDSYTEDAYLYGVGQRQDTLTDASGYSYIVMTQPHYTDLGADIAGTEHDAAMVQWGGEWRMPTLDEFMELRTQCQWEWTEHKREQGYLITGPNGNSIFLPSSLDKMHPGGQYWTASASNEPGMAECLNFIPSLAILYCAPRYQGLTIRPVLPREH